MCPSGVTWLYANCCFSELALYKSNSACWSNTKQIIIIISLIVTCARHDISEQLLNWRYAILTHSVLTFRITTFESKDMQIRNHLEEMKRKKWKTNPL